MVSFWPSFNRITGGDTDGCIACYLPLKDEIVCGIWPEPNLRIYSVLKAEEFIIMTELQQLPFLVLFIE